MLSDNRLLEAYRRFDVAVEKLAKSFAKGRTDTQTRKYILRLFNTIKRTLMKLGYSEDQITSYENNGRNAFVNHRKKLEVCAGR